jgi:parvulin-like peptidyl-prolyl isomerase
MTEQGQGAGKLSRQQRRAREREKRDATGWIAALGATDALASAIRAALGNRSATRAELEDAIGMSLVDPSAAAEEGAPAPVRAEPERVTIQHILISFAGSGTKATRTREEAAALAADTLTRAHQGEDFAALVQELTDDSSPGIYRLRNAGVASGPADEYPRERMVPAFGDVGFRLAVGEIGMADFDPRASPYGWHIIKRLQ